MTGRLETRPSNTTVKRDLESILLQAGGSDHIQVTIFSGKFSLKIIEKKVTPSRVYRRISATLEKFGDGETDEFL